MSESCVRRLKQPRRETEEIAPRPSEQAPLDLAKRVLLEEASVPAAMARLCGWRRQGEWVIGTIPSGIGRRPRFVAALR